MTPPSARIAIGIGLGLGLGLTLTIASLLASQAPSPQVVFRGGVDYVSVDVVVTGAGEKPISDLTADDFEIHENGKAQRIADFRYVSIPLAHRTIDLTQPPAPPPDVVTNAPRSVNSRLFVMIIDDLHLVESMIIPVQRVMTEFLSTLSPDDEVSILFAGRSDLSQNFTRDTGRLVKTIKSVRAAWGFGIGISSLEQLEELPYDRAVAWQLKNVAGALAHSGHARRAIVFVGAYSQLNPGAPIGSTERLHAEMVQDEMDKAWEAARRSDVPIYTLDPRGIPTPDTATSLRGNAGVVREMAGLPNRPEAEASRIVIQQDHLAEIAINTGGRFFINRSDLKGAVDEIVEENGSFYVLGYYPDPYLRDGKFHDTKVHRDAPRCSRARAARLRCGGWGRAARR